MPPSFRLRPSDNLHTIALFVANGKLYARVRIFAVFQALLRIAATPQRNVQRVTTGDPVAGTWTEERYEVALLRAVGVRVENDQT